MSNGEKSKLKALIGELEERAANLSLFDKAYEVNTHCDDLVGQVTLAVQSAIERLNQYQAEMVDEINNYRDKLLQTKGAKKNLELKKKVAKLSEEIEAFREKCARFRAKKKVDEAFEEAEEISERTLELRRQLRSQAFNGSFLRFFEKDLIVVEAIGALDSSVKDPEDDYSFKHFFLDEQISRSEQVNLKCKNWFIGDVKALLHLYDGNLAFSQENSIHVMNFETKSILFELKLDNYSYCTALAQLPSGQLVSGESHGSVMVWDLETQQLVKVIGSAGDMVVDLRVLDNGKLVALAGNISIWDLSDSTFANTPCVYLETECINWDQVLKFIMVEKRSYLTRYLQIETEIKDIANMAEIELTIGMNMKVLLDGKLAFSFSQGDGVLVQVWDANKGKKVKEIKIPGEDIESCALLTNGDFILCRADQRVEIYNVKDFNMHHAFKNEKGPIVAIRQLTPRSLLFVHLNNTKLPEFYQEKSNRLIHGIPFNTSCFLENGKRLAVGCKSHKIIVWPLED